MAILLKTVSVRVSSIQIMQVRVQNKGKRVWKSRYVGDVSVCTYPHRPKVEVFDNMVDVVELLLVPTDQASNVWHLRVLPMFSSMTSLGLLIQQSVKGELRQHDGVVTVMVM